MADDVFMNIDGLPAVNREVVAARLDARSEMAAFAAMRDQYFDALGLPADAAILELGGGTGVIGRAYVRRPGFVGRYVVTDISRSLLDHAAAKAKEEALDDRLTVQYADALTGEGVDAGAYDAVFMHTILSHVPDPEAVLRTAMSAVKSGGKIVAFDADYASMQITSGDSALDETVDLAVKRSAVAQPTIMRELPRLGRAMALERMAVQSHFLAEIGDSTFFIGLAEAISNIVVAQGGLARDDGTRWVAALRQAIENDSFFAMCPYFTYIFKKP